jgi:two-component system, OmpR family, sensor kinase
VKRRLFWKLLTGAWLTLVFVAIGNGVLFHAVANAAYPLGKEVAERYNQLKLDAAAEILQAEGPTGLRTFLDRSSDGLEVTIARQDTAAAPQMRPSSSPSRIVNTPSGVFTLTILGSLAPPRTPPLLLHIPASVLMVDFIALTLFSAVIAQYLAGPIRRLSTGMASVAEGDLDVRVAKQFGNRNDEMSDLARTFDYMAERLQQLIQARDRLLHDVSHEFRSPLARIRLAADLARQNPERWSTSLERITVDAERLNTLVEELLTMSRAQFATARSDVYFDLVELISEVASSVGFEAQAANLLLEVKLPPQLNEGSDLVLNGNPELLHKAIENILRNAVRFSKPGQTITLELRFPAEAAGTLQIDISDRGPGVAAEALERIFEPFERIGPSTDNSGFGLGLAIARSAARAHSGAIWAANRQGGGLVVTLRLPL